MLEEYKVGRKQRLESAKKVAKKANLLVKDAEQALKAGHAEESNRLTLEAVELYKRAIVNFEQTNSPIVNAAKRALNQYFKQGIGGFQSIQDFYQQKL